jgi:hypothetical protein
LAQAERRVQSESAERQRIFQFEIQPLLTELFARIAALEAVFRWPPSFSSASRSKAKSLWIFALFELFLLGGFLTKGVFVDLFESVHFHRDLLEQKIQTEIKPRMVSLYWQNAKSTHNAIMQLQDQETELTSLAEQQVTYFTTSFCREYLASGSPLQLILLLLLRHRTRLVSGTSDFVAEFSCEIARPPP